MSDLYTSSHSHKSGYDSLMNKPLTICMQINTMIDMQNLAVMPSMLKDCLFQTANYLKQILLVQNTPWLRFSFFFLSVSLVFFYNMI